MAEEEVILEGGDRDGQPVPFSAMSHEGVAVYVLHDRLGIYRHNDESPADFKDGQRVAVFEPSVPAADT